MSVSHVVFFGESVFFGRLLEELDQIVLFIGGSSQSQQGDGFDLVLGGHDQPVNELQEARVEPGSVEHLVELSHG